MNKNNVVELEDAVIRFSGDSGDGMQLTGTLFSDTAATDGNDIATFPDYPAEIRAPHNTVAGVSGFQVRFGHNKIYSIGDFCDVLIALNPASLKANQRWVKKGGIIIVDLDTFDDKGIDKAGFKSNPLKDESLSDFLLVSAPVTSKTREALKDKADNKTADRSRNMFVLGMVYYLFNKKLDNSLKFFDKKFKNRAEVAEANKIVLTSGYNFAISSDVFTHTFLVRPAKLEKGKYINISGNVATAWGLLAAAQRSGLQLFLGSYPITPATEILMELAKHKSLGARVFQAEDEIAGICSAIGASYTGAMAVTTTSGPGLSLKSEAIGLAVMTELPLIIVDVQRGGPSTGLPTKSEQSDLMQALFGRNGEAPVIIIAAYSSADCYYSAFTAAKLSLEHMTPVILLTDGNLGNGSELFKINPVTNLPEIKPPVAQPNVPNYKPYRRDENFVRQWALPGTEGLRHRVGGLEKEDITGNVSTDPLNHEKMIKLRAAKVEKIADFIPMQEVNGETEGDLLVVSWGSTFGVVKTAVEMMQKNGKKVSHAHFKHIMPLPKNTGEMLSKFKKIIVCEVNQGQFVNYLRMRHPEKQYLQFNKIQCLPFTLEELLDKFNEVLEEK